jgi:hypothetical protein
MFHCERFHWASNRRSERVTPTAVMRFNAIPLLLLLATFPSCAVSFAFAPHPPSVVPRLSMHAAPASGNDCGCEPAVTQFSGEPSSRAQVLNARQAVRGLSVFNSAGESVVFDSLLPARESRQPVIAVFLRSLG